jgi:hypothetical protein
MTSPPERDNLITLTKCEQTQTFDNVSNDQSKYSVIFCEVLYYQVRCILMRHYLTGNMKDGHEEIIGHVTGWLNCLDFDSTGGLHFVTTLC